MVTGTNQIGRKMLIKNNKPKMVLFLINTDFWPFHRYFVTLNTIREYGIKTPYLQSIAL